MLAGAVEGAMSIAPARGCSSGYRCGSHSTEISVTNRCKKYAEKLPQQNAVIGDCLDCIRVKAFAKDCVKRRRE